MSWRGTTGAIAHARARRAPPPRSRCSTLTAPPAGSPMHDIHRTTSRIAHADPGRTTRTIAHAGTERAPPAASHTQTQRARSAPSHARTRTAPQQDRAITSSNLQPRRASPARSHIHEPEGHHPQARPSTRSKGTTSRLAHSNSGCKARTFAHANSKGAARNIAQANSRCTARMIAHAGSRCTAPTIPHARARPLHPQDRTRILQRHGTHGTRGIARPHRGVCRVGPTAHKHEREGHRPLDRPSRT